MQEHPIILAKWNRLSVFLLLNQAPLKTLGLGLYPCFHLQNMPEMYMKACHYFYIILKNWDTRKIALITVS